MTSHKATHFNSYLRREDRWKQINNQPFSPANLEALKAHSNSFPLKGDSFWDSQE
jgi:hypothetical protein